VKPVEVKLILKYGPKHYRLVYQEGLLKKRLQSVKKICKIYLAVKVLLEMVGLDVEERKVAVHVAAALLVKLVRSINPYDGNTL